MKILIVYTPAGAGHRRAAEAIKEAFDKSKNDHDVQLVDSLNYSNCLFKRMYPWGYNFLVSKTPSIWGFFYYLLDFKPLQFFVRLGRGIMNFINGFKFYRFILRENPDCVISTHFFPTEIISNLKRFGLYRGKLITCVTDYGVHAFWISRKVDLYVAASEYSKKELIKKGIEQDRIRILGIPVLHKFTERKEKDTTVKNLGLKEGLFNILIMGGGLGVGPISKLVNIISKCACPFQIIVVCGKNPRLYRELEVLSTSSKMPIKVYGFVENVNELMDVSDAMISKPGGLGLSEAFVKGLPVLVTSYIAGHEAKNLKFLEKNGGGVGTRSIGETLQKLQALYASRDLLNSMKAKARLLGKPSAASDIVLLALEAMKR